MAFFIVIERSDFANIFFLSFGATALTPVGGVWLFEVQFFLPDCQLNLFYGLKLAKHWLSPYELPNELLKKSFENCVDCLLLTRLIKELFEHFFLSEFLNFLVKLFVFISQFS